MWSAVKRWLATCWRGKPQPVTDRVIGVSVDPAKCLAHEWCVHLCPEVFEYRDGSAQVRASAESFFDSRSPQILRAERECPTEAIRVRVEKAGGGLP